MNLIVLRLTRLLLLSFSLFFICPHSTCQDKLTETTFPKFIGSYTTIAEILSLCFTTHRIFAYNTCIICKQITDYTTLTHTHTHHSCTYNHFITANFLTVELNHNWTLIPFKWTTTIHTSNFILRCRLSLSYDLREIKRAHNVLTRYYSQQTLPAYVLCSSLINVWDVTGLTWRSACIFIEYAAILSLAVFAMHTLTNVTMVTTFSMCTRVCVCLAMYVDTYICMYMCVMYLKSISTPWLSIVQERFICLISQNFLNNHAVSSFF